MGGFKNIVLLLLFVMSCTPSSGEYLKDTTEHTIAYVSSFTSNATRLSREATVKILAFDSRGNRIGGSGAYVKYKQHHFVLTAAHVVDAGDSALVISDREKVIAEVVYINTETDIAVLRIEGLFTRRPLVWRPTGTLVGTPVVYTGFPNNTGLLSIQGTVSGFVGKNIILDSYAWGGSSGSVVLDKRGRIIGIVSAIDIGYAFGKYPQLLEDVVLIASIQNLKEEDLLDSLSN